MLEHKAGRYVSYEHYSALNAERDAMAAENAALRSLIREVAESSEECEFNGDEHRYVVVPESFDALTDLLEETPATDAWLNSVRAEAISSALDTCIDHCDTDCVMDAYDFSYEIAEIRSAGAIDLRDELVAYAAQLRAGKDGE